jgi:Lrp/AsnC family transcriptional regulator, leucine-responsive regulatory protein
LAKFAAVDLALALDNFDLQLLDLLQQDTRLTHAELGERVHLSASAVRRRIERMRADGVIAQEVALLNPALFEGISVIVMVSFAQESPEIYAEFRRRMIACEEVLQCYSVAGGVDFILLVAARSPADYERWGEATLMSDSNIRRYDSHVVWSEVKFITRRPRW